MKRINLSGTGPSLESLLEATEVIYPDADPLGDEYLTLLWAHPGFQKALAKLRQEFAEYEDHGIQIDVQRARRGPADTDYPLTKFAESWGISPAAAYFLTGESPEGIDRSDDEIFKRYKREARAIIVWESQFGYTVFVPRPVLSDQIESISKWLKRQNTGTVETLWGRSGNKRWQPNPALIAALPEFEEWLAGRPPTDIWRAKQEKNPELDHHALIQQLARLWERMREISPDEIPVDRPSKART